MLHWLQPNTPRRISFFIELMLAALLLHGLLLFMFFFYAIRNEADYRVTLGTVLVDLAELRIDPFMIDHKAEAKSMPSIPQLQKTLPKKVPVQKKSPTTSIKKVAPVSKKTVSKKQSAAKKTAPKPIPQKTETADQKKAAPKPEVKKSAAVEKKATPPVEQKAEHKQVTQGAYDQLELQQLLQEELEIHWQPPAGLADDLSCEIQVMVDCEGIVQKLDFVTPSGVLVYDIHAQSTLMAMQYPKQTWGRQLTVTFKQT